MFPSSVTRLKEVPRLFSINTGDLYQSGSLRKDIARYGGQLLYVIQ